MEKPRSGRRNVPETKDLVIDKIMLALKCHFPNPNPLSKDAVHYLTVVDSKKTDQENPHRSLCRPNQTKFTTVKQSPVFYFSSFPGLIHCFPQLWAILMRNRLIIVAGIWHFIIIKSLTDYLLLSLSVVPEMSLKLTAKTRNTNQVISFHCG